MRVVAGPAYSDYRGTKRFDGHYVVMPNYTVLFAVNDAELVQDFSEIGPGRFWTGWLYNAIYTDSEIFPRTILATGGKRSDLLLFAQEIVEALSAKP